MIPRHSQILQSLRKKGHCSVEELCLKFAVSDMTIRRDLHTLENSGHVLRTHGGAALAERVAFEFGFLERSMAHRAAKRAIAAAAFAELGRAKTILVDSGTTTLALAEHLRGSTGLTVITTSLPIASALQFSEGVDLILLGGLLRRQSPDLSGPLTESNLESLHADVAFIGADAIDRHGRAYNESLPVARMLEKMTAASDRFYIMADSSKFGRKALAGFGNKRQPAGLITDSGLSPTLRRSLKAAGVKLMIAKPIPKNESRQ
ncbi:MAG: DeoR/GlpR family DNA-binding transcription regulator [Verrucomicrobiota bacterium]